MAKKTFQNEFLIFKNKLVNNEIFSLVRFGDGELAILEKRYIDLTEKCNGEFLYDPANSLFEFYRGKLIESLKFRARWYYVGIMTQCCYIESKSHGHDFMKKLSGQSEQNLTFASLFMNANYIRTLVDILPVFNNYEIVTVVNKTANLDNLPFKVKKVFTVGKNAWIDDYNLVDKIKNYINLKTIKNYLFIFCAGPLSNILVCELTKFNSNNTYLNFGSALDEYIFSEPSRWYHYNNELLRHDCIWE